MNYESIKLLIKFIPQVLLQYLEGSHTHLLETKHHCTFRNHGWRHEGFHCS